MFRKRTWLSMLTATVLVLTISWVGIPGAAAAVPRCSGKKATILGTDHADVLKGTSGRDVIAGLGGADTIEGLRGDDFICGGLGDDTILGSRGGDFIKDGGGGDVVDAGPGFDWLNGGPGDDQIEAGPDLGGLDYRAAPGPVTVDLVAGTTLGWGADTIAGIAGVWGSDFDDVLSGSDECVGGGILEVLVGFEGDDVLSGLGGDDTFQGGEGNDSIDGGDGNDFIEGGPGDDRIEGGLGFDWLDLQQAPGPLSVDLSAGTASGEGTDLLSGVEAVFGSAFDDTLTDDEARNQLYGDPGGAGGCFIDNDPCPFGNDVIRGGGGDDFLAGGSGDDELFGTDGKRLEGRRQPGRRAGDRHPRWRRRSRHLHDRGRRFELRGVRKGASEHVYLALYLGGAADRAFLAAASRVLPRGRWTCFLLGCFACSTHRDLGDEARACGLRLGCGKAFCHEAQARGGLEG